MFRRNFPLIVMFLLFAGMLYVLFSVPRFVPEPVVPIVPEPEEDPAGQRQQITEEFISLLDEDPELQELVEKCGYNRQTFYYHFLPRNTSANCASPAVPLRKSIPGPTIFWSGSA